MESDNYFSKQISSVYLQIKPKSHTSVSLMQWLRYVQTDIGTQVARSFDRSSCMVSIFDKIDDRSCSTCSATPSRIGCGCGMIAGSAGGSTTGSLLPCISINVKAMNLYEIHIRLERYWTRIEAIRVCKPLPKQPLIHSIWGSLACKFLDCSGTHCEEPLPLPIPK